MERYTFVFKRSLTEKEKKIHLPDFFVYDDEKREDRVSFFEKKENYESNSTLYTHLYNQFNQYVKDNHYEDIEMVSMKEEAVKIQPENEILIEVFIWNGVTDDVRISEPGANVRVVVHNCDEDYSDKEAYRRALSNPGMSLAEWTVDNYEEREE